MRLGKGAGAHHEVLVEAQVHRGDGRPWSHLLELLAVDLLAENGKVILLHRHVFLLLLAEKFILSLLLQKTIN